MLTVHRTQTTSESPDTWLGPAPWIIVAPPGLKVSQAIGRDQRVSSPSLNHPYPLVINRARGSVVEDLDGNRYLDFTAGNAACVTGHCHPQVTEAVKQQAELLLEGEGSACCGPAVSLTEKLAEVAPGESRKRVLLTNSRSEAIDATIKLARHHTRRPGIIAFHGASHGRTMGALSLGASDARYRQHFGPLLPMVFHAPYGDLDFITEHLFKQIITPGEVAAMFVEPLQAQGEFVIPPPDFLAGLRQLCDEHGILLVADEAYTGMGRTGRMFCIEHHHVEPDILIVGKGLAGGLPLAAVVAREKIVDWTAGVHESTSSGNPVSCAAALATLDLIDKQVLKNAQRLAPLAISKLEAITSHHKCIVAARGMGLMLAVSIVKDGRTREPNPHLRNRIVQEAFNRGLLLLPCGESSIRFTPPLSVNRVQLEVGLDVFSEAVATVAY